MHYAANDSHSLVRCFDKVVVGELERNIITAYVAIFESCSNIPPRVGFLILFALLHARPMWYASGCSEANNIGFTPIQQTQNGPC